MNVVDQSGRIPVLLYHAVPDSEDPGDPLAVPRERFLSHLRAILGSGRSALTISDLAAAIRGELTFPERPIAITFDDAYADTLGAVEELRRVGLSSTVFVTTGQIGTGSMISTDDLVELSRHPDEIELGAHTVSHPYLDELEAAEIEAEVRGSKARLEELVGREVESFAYPFGAHEARARDAVITAGFTAAAAVKNAFSHPGDDPWAIARWTVRAQTSTAQLEAILAGSGAPTAWSRERRRTSLYRGARRLRGRLGSDGWRR